MKITDIDLLISRNLKRIMGQKNIRQVDLVNMTGISKKTISGYVNGKAVIGKEIMQKLCKALNIRPVDFYYEDDTSTSLFVAEQKSSYGIPENCPADPVCQQVCIHCMSLPPDDKKSTLSLLEIFKYGRDSTKTAIRQNISEFHEHIRPSDHEKDFKRSKKATGSGSK